MFKVGFRCWSFKKSVIQKKRKFKQVLERTSGRVWKPNQFCIRHKIHKRHIPSTQISPQLSRHTYGNRKVEKNPFFENCDVIIVTPYKYGPKSRGHFERFPGELDESSWRRHGQDLVAGQRRSLTSGRRTRGPSAKEDPQVQSGVEGDKLLVGGAHGKVPTGE